MTAFPLFLFFIFYFYLLNSFYLDSHFLAFILSFSALLGGLEGGEGAQVAGV